MPEGSLFTYFLLIIVGVLFAIILYYRYIAYTKSKKTKNRFARGRLLETQARDFLITKGYKILDEQKLFEHKYFVNNDRKLARLIVDYYVSKNGKKYLVEVKSGQSAISTSNSNTRRQLLEYSFAIPNDGVLLLDMENQKLEMIDFINYKNQSLFLFIKVLLIFSAIGIIIPFWSLKIIILLIISIIFLLRPGFLFSIAAHVTNLLNNR